MPRSSHSFLISERVNTPILIGNETHLHDLLLRHVLAVREVVLGGGVEHVRHDATGRDGVDGDPLLAAVDGQARHEGLDGALGGRVERVLGHHEALGRVGARQDDAPAPAQVLVRLAGDEELAARVEAEDAVEFLL